MEVSAQLHDLAALPQEKAAGTHWLGVVVSSRAVLDFVEKRKIFTLSGIELRPSSPSLYRVSYPGS
jgi:hypothetical protein